MDKPDRKWKTGAFSQFHRAPKITPDKGRYMGLSLVTDRYHYVEWRTWDHEKGIAGELKAIELYDQKTDPKENTNVADVDENKAIVEKLALQLKQGWKEARPEIGK